MLALQPKMHRLRRCRKEQKLRTPESSIEKPGLLQRTTVGCVDSCQAVFGPANVRHRNAPAPEFPAEATVAAVFSPSSATPGRLNHAPSRSAHPSVGEEAQVITRAQVSISTTQALTARRSCRV